MTSTLPQPVPPTTLIRILVGVIIVLSFLAGYYHSVWRAETDKNIQLEAQLREVE
jgi:hypothetical protein